MNNLITRFEEINMEDKTNSSTSSNEKQIQSLPKKASTIANSNSTQSAQSIPINFPPSRENFTLILEELYKRIEESEFNEIIEKIRQKDERFVFAKTPKSPQVKKIEGKQNLLGEMKNELQLMRDYPRKFIPQLQNIEQFLKTNYMVNLPKSAQEFIQISDEFEAVANGFQNLYKFTRFKQGQFYDKYFSENKIETSISLQKFCLDNGLPYSRTRRLIKFSRFIEKFNRYDDNDEYLEKLFFLIEY